MRVRLIAGALLAACVVTACGGGPAATSTPAPVVTTAPTPTAAPPTVAATPAPTAAASTTVTNTALGLEVTVPTGWIAITPEIAADSAAIAALKAAAGSNAKTVDTLIASFTGHPEYWMVGSDVTGQNVVAGSLRTNTGDLAAWTTAQETALKNAYGTVETKALSSPKPGTMFTFTAGQFVSRLYGFARPNGMAIFTFAGPVAAGPQASWDGIVASFKDAGT